MRWSKFFGFKAIQSHFKGKDEWDSIQWPEGRISICLFSAIKSKIKGRRNIEIYRGFAQAQTFVLSTEAHAAQVSPNQPFKRRYQEHMSNIHDNSFS